MVGLTNKFSKRTYVENAKKFDFIFEDLTTQCQSSFVKNIIIMSSHFMLSMFLNVLSTLTIYKSFNDRPDLLSFDETRVLRIDYVKTCMSPILC